MELEDLLRMAMLELELHLAESGLLKVETVTLFPVLVLELEEEQMVSEDLVFRDWEESVLVLEEVAKGREAKRQELTRKLPSPATLAQENDLRRRNLFIWNGVTR